MLLSEIAEVSRTVAATSARLAKIETLAGALRAAGPLEVPIAVAYLSGELPQRQIGVGWAALRGVSGGGPPGQHRGTASRPRPRRAHPVRRGRGLRRDRGGLREGFGGRAQGAGRRAVRPRHRGRAAVPGRPALRRAAPGGAGGSHDRGRRAGGCGAGRRGPPGHDAARLAGRGGRRRAVRRQRARWPASAWRSAARSGRCSPPARPASTTPWPRSAPRSRWSGSSTASGSRRTCPAGTSACSPGRSTTSPPGCPTWWRSWPSCRCRARCWTVS